MGGWEDRQVKHLDALVTWAKFHGLDLDRATLGTPSIWCRQFHHHVMNPTATAQHMSCLDRVPYVKDLGPGRVGGAHQSQDTVIHVPVYTPAKFQGEDVEDGE